MDTCSDTTWDQVVRLSSLRPSKWPPSTLLAWFYYARCALEFSVTQTSTTRSLGMQRHKTRHSMIICWSNWPMPEPLLVYRARCPNPRPSTLAQFRSTMAQPHWSWMIRIHCKSTQRILFQRIRCPLVLALPPSPLAYRVIRPFP
jgi:hypothetical protein